MPPNDTPPSAPNGDRPTAALAALSARLRRGVRATPDCLAVLGWLCDDSATSRAAELRLSGDGSVWLRLSGEAAPAALCSYLEFLQQVRVICESLGLAEDQSRAVVAWARAKLG